MPSPLPASIRLLFLVPVLPAFFFAGCGKQRPVRAEVASVPVRSALATRQDLPLTRNAVGVVQPLHTVAVLSQVEGVVTKVHFRDGDEVKAGDRLVTLDQRPYQAALQAAEAQLAQARANLTKASADFDRYEKLHQQNAVSDADYSQYSAAAAAARASVAVQEAAVATAKLNLDYTEIRAPFAGRTSRLALREGSLVRANDSSQPLLTINQLAPIGVSLSLPESDLAALQAAMKAGPVEVRARTQGAEGRMLTGRLDYLDNTVGLNTGTVALRATFDNADGSLWPGQFVDATVKVGEVTGALVVPALAVVAGQQGDQVFVVKPDLTIEVRLVRTGITAGDLVVVDHVQEGERVVTDGQIRLIAGSKVVLEDGENPPAATAAQAKRSSP